MTTGYQIYKKSKENNFFETAGFINWFSNLKEAEDRKAKLEATWNKYGVEYTIIKCHE